MKRPSAFEFILENIIVICCLMVVVFSLINTAKANVDIDDSIKNPGHVFLAI